MQDFPPPADQSADETQVAFVGVVELSPDELAELQRQAEEEEKEQERRRQEALKGLGLRVLGELASRKGLRTEIEQRWHSDLRRYNGQYDPGLLQRIKSREYGSTAFVPLTSRVCNIVEARLSDMLFPSDERNFSVTATPMPELAEIEKFASKMDPSTTLRGGLQAGDIAAHSKAIRAEHKSAADAMEREIDDQLRESNYGKAARSAIRDGIVTGMGVLKGPTLVRRVKKAWQQGPDGQWGLQVIEDVSPGVCWVDYWNFYPDPAAMDIRDATPIELHYMSPADMRNLAGVPNFFPDAIREVLKVRPGRVLDANREELRMAAGTQGASLNAYKVAEYHGPIEMDEALALGLPVPMMADGDPDPLVAFSAVVFVAEDGTVIGAEMSAMPGGDHPYSTFHWRKDVGSPYGFGLAHDVADMQDLANSTFRAAVDNMGLSVGPQMVVGKGIRPSNGQWVIEPNKLWEQEDDSMPVRDAFGFFQIATQVPELMKLFETIKALIDEVSGSQLAMMGQEAPSFMETARGASMAYNAANIWMRRAVRMWDDDATAPLIGRFIDWNMQHNLKKEIKGDLHAVGRGTSALLEAESQAQKLASFIELNKDLPMSLLNKVQQRRQFAKAMRLDSIDLLPADEEIPALEKQLAEQSPPPNPELERVRIRELDLKDRAEERQFQAAMEQSRREMRMAEIASREQTTVAVIQQKYKLDEAKLGAVLQDKQEARAQDAQRFNAEMVVKQRMGSGI